MGGRGLCLDTRRPVSGKSPESRGFGGRGQEERRVWKGVWDKRSASAAEAIRGQGAGVFPQAGVTLISPVQTEESFEIFPPPRVFLPGLSFFGLPLFSLIAI